jgi:hypothetical protein
MQYSQKRCVGHSQIRLASLKFVLDVAALDSHQMLARLDTIAGCDQNFGYCSRCSCAER